MTFSTQTTVSRFRLILVLVLLLTFSVGPFQASTFALEDHQSTNIEAPSEQGDQEQTQEGHPSPGLDLSRAVKSIFVELNGLFQTVWHKLSWVSLLFLVVLFIKRVLLKESYSEIVACGLELIAYFLLHGIGTIRFCAHHLKKLAKDLRDQAAEG